MMRSVRSAHPGRRQRAAVLAWLRRPRRAFTLMELMLTLAVLLILVGLVIQLNGRDWRREQVNAVVIELAGWLESVRRGAIKGSSCTVTIEHGDYASAGPALLGKLEPSSCGNVQPFRLVGLSANQAIHVVETRSFTFTPAGTLFPPPSAKAPIVIRLHLTNHTEPERCLQLDGLLGVIDVGHSQGTNVCVIGEGI